MIYVAQGGVDAYVEYGVHAWDIAAAGIIVKEAGGVVMDPTGTYCLTLLINNPLHAYLLYPHDFHQTLFSRSSCAQGNHFTKSA